jgi:hypothetical protein
MASYPLARPDLWIRICPCHIQHTTNEITNTRAYFNNRRRQMAAHTKSHKREKSTIISSNMVPLFHLSFVFIYDYPPTPLHTSFNHQNYTAYKLLKVKNAWGLKQ